jgi:hypothetical protein
MSVSPIDPERTPLVRYVLTAAEVVLTILCVVVGTAVTIMDAKNELCYLGVLFFAAVWASTVIPIHFVNGGFFGRSILSRYKKWVGGYSYVVQSLLLTWTMLGLSGQAVLTHVWFTPEKGIPDDIAGYVLLTFVVLGLYATIGLPLLIAAFVTLRMGRDGQSRQGLAS